MECCERKFNKRGSTGNESKGDFGPVGFDSANADDLILSSLLYDPLFFEVDVWTSRNN